MAPQPDPELLERVRANLNDLSAWDLEQHLIRKESLGTELNFEQGRGLFESVLKMVRLSRSLSLSLVPDNLMRAIDLELNNLRTALDRIKTFAPTDLNNPGGSRAYFIEELAKVYDRLYAILGETLLSNALIGTTQEDLKGMARQVKDDVEALGEATKQRAQALLTEAQALLEAQKAAVADTGVSVHGKHFSDEAHEHADNAKKWLIATYGIVAGIVAIGVIFLCYYQRDPNSAMPTFDSVQLTVTKVIIFVGLFFALGMATKNYKAHRHNAVLNKHRQNALQTFETFVKAAGGDAQTKNAVLLEATRTIFSNHPTGYLHVDGDSDSPNKVIEIFKGTGSHAAN